MYILIISLPRKRRERNKCNKKVPLERNLLGCQGWSCSCKIAYKKSKPLADGNAWLSPRGNRGIYDPKITLTQIFKWMLFMVARQLLGKRPASSWLTYVYMSAHACTNTHTHTHTHSLSELKWAIRSSVCEPCCWMNVISWNALKYSSYRGENENVFKGCCILSEMSDCSWGGANVWLLPQTEYYLHT